MVFIFYNRSSDRWQNFIPQARRGLNRGYGAIRRHNTPPEAAAGGQRNSPYAPPASAASVQARGGHRGQRPFQDQDETDDSTETSTDDAEMQSEESDDPGLAVEPVGQSPNSNSQVWEFYAQAFLRSPCSCGRAELLRTQTGVPLFLLRFVLFRPPSYIFCVTLVLSLLFL